MTVTAACWSRSARNLRTPGELNADAQDCVLIHIGNKEEERCEGDFS